MRPQLVLAAAVRGTFANGRCAVVRDGSGDDADRPLRRVWVFLAIGAVAALYSRNATGIAQRPQGAERSEAPGVGAGHSHISSADDETAGPQSTGS